MTAREQVRLAFIEASKTVAAAVGLLNATVHACPTCGLNKAEQWDEKQIADQATAVVLRLQRLAQQLERTHD